MARDKDGVTISQPPDRTHEFVEMVDNDGVVCPVRNQPGAVRERLDLGWRLLVDVEAEQPAEPAPPADDPPADPAIP